MKETRMRADRGLRRRFLGAGWKWCTSLLSLLIHQYSDIFYLIAGESGKGSLALWPEEKVQWIRDSLCHSQTLSSLNWAPKCHTLCMTQVSFLLFFFLLCNRFRCVTRELWILLFRIESCIFLIFPGARKMKKLMSFVSFSGRLQVCKESRSYSQIEKQTACLTLNLNKI